jgi:hypothetical protein
VWRPPAVEPPPLPHRHAGAGDVSGRELPSLRYAWFPFFCSHSIGAAILNVTMSRITQRMKS